METIFYVVRTTYCEYIYGSLKDAKAIAAVMLDTHSARVVIIERANQRLLKVPTITVNQTSHTDGMFDLCVESDIYTTMLARLVRVEGVKVPSADNTGNETDKN